MYSLVSVCFFFSSQGSFDFLSSRDRYDLLHFFCYLIFFFIPFFPDFLFLANPFGIIESMHIKNLCIVCLFSSTLNFGSSHSYSLPHLLLAFSVLCFELRWSVAEALYPCLFFAFKFSVSSVHYSTGNFYYQLFFQLLVFNEL